MLLKKVFSPVLIILKSIQLLIKALMRRLDLQIQKLKALLHYYGQDVHYETVKEKWYDGYRFGSADVYCPWDVINYCSDHRADDNLAPKNCGRNTSGNNVISHFIDSINEPQKLTKIELERLVNGGMVQKEINEELTYKELYSSIDNLWSTLFYDRLFNTAWRT